MLRGAGPMDSVHEVVTTVLEVLAVLAVGFGVSAGLWPLVGGWSVAAGGVVVIGAVEVAEWTARRKRGVR